MRNRYTAQSRLVTSVINPPKWRLEWNVYDRTRRVATATSERQARLIARALNAAAANQ